MVNPRFEEWLARIEAKIDRITHRQETELSELTDLTDAMTAITTSVGNAVTEINALADTIKNNAQDPAAIEAAVGNLKTLASNLDSAVSSAQTPQTPPATPPTS